jgi:hypothetical protein
MLLLEVCVAHPVMSGGRQQWPDVKPDPGDEPVPLTNGESLVRSEVAEPANHPGRYHAQSGKGTASSLTLGILLECAPIHASGIFARRHLHVVRHGRIRHDSAI